MYTEGLLLFILMVSIISFATGGWYSKRVRFYLEVKKVYGLEETWNCVDIWDLYTCAIDYLSKTNHSREAKLQMKSVFRKETAFPGSVGPYIKNAAYDLDRRTENHLVPSLSLTRELLERVKEDEKLSFADHERILRFTSLAKEYLKVREDDLKCFPSESKRFKATLNLEIYAHYVIQELKKGGKKDETRVIEFLIEEIMLRLIEEDDFSSKQDVISNIQACKENSKKSIRPFVTNIQYFKLVKGIIDCRQDLSFDEPIKAEIKKKLVSFITQGMRESGIVADRRIKQYFSDFLDDRLRITEQFQADMKIVEAEARRDKGLSVQLELLYLMFQSSISLQES
jgi:hypothetical protein